MFAPSGPRNQMEVGDTHKNFWANKKAAITMNTSTKKKSSMMSKLLGSLTGGRREKSVQSSSATSSQPLDAPSNHSATPRNRARRGTNQVFMSVSAAGPAHMNLFGSVSNSSSSWYAESMDASGVGRTGAGSRR
ncbi:expressed unknown protein [Seminavis robusta]|uniref:Uncharacterized protein n=1 Tax=Seminavis robusta TaxID=568900 RepID=A0A9N8HI79_9STRA|nr:expressed unknown protein [Seminavis robusta]|eukprot:Sro578_g169760.1 n/a (134) ;mRNA; f:2629-3030